MNLELLKKNPVYRELVTELKISRQGGVFLSLYRDKEVIKLVCGDLERNLPEYLFMAVEADAKNTRIAAILEKNALHSGEKISIFHIIETEKPTDRFRRDFLDYLLYTRQRFQSRPYSMVFWVTPEFEKELYYTGSDLYHLITGTYDFSGIETEPPAGRKKTERIPKTIPAQPLQIPAAIELRLEAAVRQFEHWAEAKAEGGEFSLKAMQLHNYQAIWQDFAGVDQTGQSVPLFETLDQRLHSPNTQYLTITGETALDRTACLINYYIRMARRFIQDKDHSPIPVFITLNDYRGRINLNDLVLKEFYQRFNLEVESGVFQQLARKGRFVFLLDGLEQINSSSDLKLVAENLKTLLKLSLNTIKAKTKSDASPNQPNKVLLTCSSHYIYRQLQPSRQTQDDYYTKLYAAVADKPDHEILRMVAPPLLIKDIEAFIQQFSEASQYSASMLKICRDQKQIQEIASEQLIFYMIRQIIPDAIGGKEVNIADIYQQYANRWIENDDWRSILKPEGKRAFMWELALKMGKMKNKYQINSRRIEPPKKSLLKDAYKHRNLDYYQEESATCPFLELDADGNYQFIHTSFVDYFLADYFFHCLKQRNNKQISYSSFNNNMKLFLKMIICANRHNLEKIDLCGVNLEYIELNQANLKNAKLQRTQLNYSSLAGANFEGADLTRTSLRKTDLRQANLARAKLVQTDLTEAQVSGADLTEADLQRSRLNDADFSAVILKRAKLNDVDMTNASFIGADLTGADLRWSNLQRARFSSANLSEARLLQANCHEADFSKSCLQRANLNNSDMTRANFEQADMKHANLNKANLYEANLQKADLMRANLQKANLQRSDFTEANLHKANLIKTDLRWANLSKADLSEADLWQANLNEADISDAIYDVKDLEKAYSDGVKTIKEKKIE